MTFPTAIHAGDGKAEAVVRPDNLCAGDSTRDERCNTSGERGLEEVTTFVDHSFKTSSSEDEEDIIKEQERKPNPRLQKQSKKTISD